ncbi:hypothetical protein LCGC14_2021260 [marine sediment metagenome]|uniref:Uncharacterized protein n=1 Tax=marine sediment metagenome TaxID=412755 RepID=A0A0F9EXP4_9ZZZZ
MRATLTADRLLEMWRQYRPVEVHCSAYVGDWDAYGIAPQSLLGTQLTTHETIIYGKGIGRYLRWRKAWLGQVREGESNG